MIDAKEALRRIAEGYWDMTQTRDRPEVGTATNWPDRAAELINENARLRAEVVRLRDTLWSCHELLTTFVAMGYPGSDADAVTMTIINARTALGVAAGVRRPCPVCRGAHPPCDACGEDHCELDACPDL